MNWRGWFRSRPPLRRNSDRDGTAIRIAIAMPVEPVTGTERRMVVVPRVRYNKRPHEESRRSSTRKRLPKTAVFAEFQPRWTSPEHVDDPGGTKPRIPPTWLDLKRGQGMDATSDDDRLNKPPPERAGPTSTEGTLVIFLPDHARSSAGSREREYSSASGQFFRPKGGASPMNSRGTGSRMSLPHPVPVATKAMASKARRGDRRGTGRHMGCSPVNSPSLVKRVANCKQHVPRKKSSTQSFAQS